MLGDMYAVDLNPDGTVTVRGPVTALTNHADPLMTYPSYDHVPQLLQDRISIIRLLAIGEERKGLGARLSDTAMLIYDFGEMK